MEYFEVLSLEKSCIAALARDFDTFLVALDRNENVAVKHHLQRNESNTLFVNVKSPLRKRHALFLINRYLKKLDLNRFCAADIDDVIKILKRQGEGILAVQFIEGKGGPHPKTILVQVAHSLPSTLKSLSLSGKEYSNIALKIVTENCFNLQELNLRCHSVTDAGIEAAFSNSTQPINYRLRKLDLYWTAVTARGIVSVLNNCPNLTEIHHDDVADAISLAYTRHLENNDVQFKKYNLETLDLDSDELEAVQKMCPNIKRLTVSEIRTQRQMNICKGFERLEDIHFECSEPVLLSPFFETRGSALHAVTISGNVTVPVQTLMQFCPEIQCLHLYKVKIGSGERQNFDPVRFSLQNLKELAIGYIDQAAEMRHIDTIFAFAPNIKTFYVYTVSGFTHTFVNTIAAHGFPSLTDLHIFWSEVDAQSVRKLINDAPNLKRVSIHSFGYVSPTEYDNVRLLKDELSRTYDVY